MSVINYPINTIVRSENKLTGTNSNFTFKFDFDSTLYKYKLFQLELKSLILPHTISAGSSTDNNYAYCDIRLNGVNFLCNCDTNDASNSIGFFTNNQYSIDGKFCIDSVVGFKFLMENPKDKTVNLIFNFYDSSNNSVSYTCNNSILIFTIEPYFLAEF